MKSNLVIFFAILAVLGLVSIGMSQDKPTSASTSKPAEVSTTNSAKAATASSEYTVIGYIETRDRTITIKAGPKGTVYSVKTADGKVLCENLSKEQLRAQAPEIGEFIKNAVAGSATAKVDARM